MSSGDLYAHSYPARGGSSVTAGSSNPTAFEGEPGPSWLLLPAAPPRRSAGPEGGGGKAHTLEVVPNPPGAGLSDPVAPLEEGHHHSSVREGQNYR